MYVCVCTYAYVNMQIHTNSYRIRIRSKIRIRSRIRIRDRIRNSLKSRIRDRVRKKSFRIHNTAFWSWRVFYRVLRFNFPSLPLLFLVDLHPIQVADDKSGQFLDQDIEASASHRNVLRYFLKSFSSLVSPNVNKPLILTKICRQKTCEAVLKALRAGRNQQEIARLLKRAQVPDLPFEESFEPKPDCWVGRCHYCPKFEKKISLASRRQWILWPGHPKHSQNHPGLAEGQP